MIFLDAYALVALAMDEPSAEAVQEILRSEDARVTVVNLAETVDVAARVHGAPGRLVRDAFEPLLLSKALTGVVSDERDAWRAGELRAHHYDRRTRALSLPDCFLVTHALDDRAAIATADPAVAGVARAEGVEVIPLPDSAGRRP